MKTLFGIVWLAVFCAACHHEEDIVKDASGVAVKLPHLWYTSLSDNKELIEVVTAAQIIYDGTKVVVGANKANRRYLAGLDSETGKVDWMWSDLLGLRTNPTYLDPISISEDQYHVYQNKLMFTFSSSTYCIDLDKGATFWKHRVDLNRFDVCTGLGNMFINSGRADNSQLGEELYVGQLLGDPIEKPIVRPVYDRTEYDPGSFQYGYIERELPFVAGKDTMIAVLFIDPTKTGSLYQTAMGLYNYTQKRWVYERAILNGPSRFSNITWAKLYNGRIYHTSGRSMHCHDVLTGEEIWSVPFSQGFALSGFTIADGKIFTTNSDRYTYCLDPNTGRQIWKEESSGSSSPISYLNGVLYFLGGGDGKLHAIDASTGQHLWRLKSPDEAKDSGAFFYGVCVAVPGSGSGKGRIVAMTGLGAYGYEAIR